MEAQSGRNIERCSKHPSQLVTGICSSCLMERLLTVADAEPLPSRREIVEMPVVSRNNSEPNTKVRVRTTLLMLFQLDDESERNASSQRIEDLEVVEESKWEGAPIGLNPNPALSKSTAERGRNDDASGCKEIASQDGSSAVGHFEGCNGMEMENSLKAADDDMVFPESGRGSRGSQRHSWDGSVLGKAIPCPFKCFEERRDGSAGRSRERPLDRSLNERKVISKSLSQHDSPGRSVRLSNPEGQIGAMSCEHPQVEFGVSHPPGKKSRRWCDVWITSPLVDFVKRREQVLERSLSESRTDTWKGKRVDIVEGDGRVQNSGSSSRSVNSMNRSFNASSGEFQSCKADLQKKKESIFRRSRSVHYSSPRSIDSGLLRFYLTPLRSIRSTNRPRRSSRSFARSILGFF